jgi:hypothetical protein
MNMNIKSVLLIIISGVIGGLIVVYISSWL